ncbi:MAG TPA: HD domain-containing phosphohydrolase [Mycobacteriales bacterium]|jgi:hypothetical protein
MARLGRRVPIPHVVAAALTLAAVVSVAVGGFRGAGTVLTFGAVIGFGELTRLVLPGDRDSAPLASAAALGLALATSVHGQGSVHGAAEVVVAVAAAGLLGASAHAYAGRDARLGGVARRIIGASVTAAIARPLATGGVLGDWVAEPTAQALVLAAAATAGLAVDLAIGAAVRAARHQTRYGRSVRADLAALWRLHLAVLATGWLLSYGTALMGPVAVLVFGLPLTVTQFAFLRHATVRTTFRQTIRSMARVTEIGGYVHEGHSARVAQLALRVGRQLGLGDDDLLDLEYAALLHDIGQLSLTEPIPGGSTLAVPAADRRRVAELGADIVRSTGRLERVAAIVSAQSEPYRGVGETSDPAVPLASRIVKAASAYDDLVHGTAGERYSPLEALERLSLGLAYDYDPVVVAALGRSVTRPR